MDGEGPEVTDVSIVGTRVVTPGPTQLGETRRWMDIVITVRNRSSEKTYYMVSGVRNLQYDSDTRTLTVGLYELAEGIPNPGFVRSPQLTAVLPEASTHLKISVPTIMRQMKVSNGGIEVEEIDVSNLRNIRVVVSFDVVPFRPVLSDRPDVARQRFHEWGETVEATYGPLVGGLRPSGRRAKNGSTKE
jgi:hypothetical protein